MKSYLFQTRKFKIVKTVISLIMVLVFSSTTSLGYANNHFSRNMKTKKNSEKTNRTGLLRNNKKTKMLPDVLPEIVENTSLNQPKDFPSYAPGQILVHYKNVDNQANPVRGNALISEHELVVNKVNIELNNSIANYKPIAKSFTDKMVEENKSEKEILKDIADEKSSRKGKPFSSSMSRSKQSENDNFELSKLLLINLANKDADVSQAVEEINGLTTTINGKTYEITAEPNYIASIYFTPNDNYYLEQWAHPKSSAPLGWDIERGNSETRIAIIDTGVDYNHPDLADNIYMPPGANTDFVNINTAGYPSPAYYV